MKKKPQFFGGASKVTDFKESDPLSPNIDPTEQEDPEAVNAGFGCEGEENSEVATPRPKHMDFTTTEEDLQFFEELENYQDADDSYDFEIREQEAHFAYLEKLQEI